MNVTAIVQLLTVVVSKAGEFLPVLGDRYAALVTELSAFTERTELDSSEPIPEALQRLFRDAAFLLNYREVKLKHGSRLGLDGMKLRELMVRAMQRSLHASGSDLAAVAQDLGWERIGERLEDIELPLLLGGLIENTAQASKWAFAVVDFTGRIHLARNLPVPPPDSLDEGPLSEADLMPVRHALEEFACDLDLLVQWLPRQ